MQKKITKDLQKCASKEKAEKSAYFFKTGPGQYGEGDIFIGCTVPEQRTIAKKYVAASLNEVLELLHAPIHEHRFTALLILILKFEKGTEKDKEQIYKKYLSNTKYINNWDLVDVSSHKIVGAYLRSHKDKTPILYKLVKSKDLWERRIAIVSTWEFIKNKELTDTFKLSELLLEDQSDLMHKASGWMLREMGKKNIQGLRKFLDKYSKTMPRTMLRYSIEKLDKKERTKYMAK